MSDFDTAFAHVVGIEGGYSNNPSDPGGETMFGITAKVARANGYTGQMQSMPLDFAKTVYRNGYWLPLQADLLPPMLREFLFDYAVNSGTTTAARALQHAVGALPDGVIGPKTLAQAAKQDALHIMRLVFVDRACLMAACSNFEDNKHGWMGRLFDVTVRGIKED